jgi:drug/metabolite transporter (DMT)-like permease
MPKWLTYSLLSLAFYGVWAIVSDHASNRIGPLPVQVLSTVGLVAVSLVLFLSKDWKTGKNRPLGCAHGFATGLLAAGGTWSMFEAFSRGGEAATVIPLICTYPILTVVLARIFLKEKPNRIQLAGIVLAIVAILLLAEIQLSGTGSTKWLPFALLALVFFGTSGITQKLSTTYVSTELSTLVFTGAFAAVAVAIAATQGLDWKMPTAGAVEAIGVGVLFGLAILTQFAAYTYGSASVVTVLTSLSQVVTVILGVIFLHQKLGALKGAGVVIGLIAGVALSYEGKPPPAPVPLKKEEDLVPEKA